MVCVSMPVPGSEPVGTSSVAESVAESEGGIRDGHLQGTGNAKEGINFGNCVILIV